MDHRKDFILKFGLAVARVPETKEEIETVKLALQHAKSGVETQRRLDKNDIQRNAFSGQTLVNWAIRYFHVNSRTSAADICHQLLQKDVFRSLNHPNAPGGEFRDSAQSWYCHSEDEFDKYLEGLPEEQLVYITSLIIGPLGVRATIDPHRPLSRSKIISWLLKRFIDIKNRSEAVRLLVFLVTKGYLQQVDEDSYLLRPDFNFNTDNLNIPLDICGICKHFTAILSYQTEVTLSCGHTFHRACLACLQSDEMGRCSDCDSNISTIKTNTELDLILPFITKILSSPTYDFKPRIDQFVLAFNEKYAQLNKTTKDSPKAILQQSLEELSSFIVNLNDNVLQDLRLLMRFEHGREKCLLILKKCIIPKVYGSLFQLYIKVNAELDKKLYQKIASLLPVTTTETIDIKPKFRLVDTAKTQVSRAPSVTPSPKILANAKRQLSTPVALTPHQRQNTRPTSFPLLRTNDGESVEPLEKPTEPYIMAINEFDRMLDYTDVYDKLNCLILVRHYIQDSIIAYWKKRGQFNQDDLIMDTDQVVLILCYVIIHSQVPHLFSEFNFIDDFIDVFSERDEPGYCVTILHTALMYIRDTLEIPSNNHHTNTTNGTNTHTPSHPPQLPNDKHKDNAQ
jgi:hypothetical protein